MKNKVFMMIKGLLVAWIVSGLLMLLFSWIMYSTMMDDSMGEMFAKVIYAVSAVFSGIVVGKISKAQKFLWGLASGVLYFLSIVILTAVFKGQIAEYTTAALQCFAISCIGGMFGGMIS